MTPFGLAVSQTRFLADLNKHVELGWLALYFPVAGFLFWRIVRGLRAERYAEQSLGEDISTVRDACITQEVTPTIAKIAATVRDYMKDFKTVDFLPGEPGDPQIEAERVLGYKAPTFSGSMRDLQQDYAKITRVTSAHHRKVAECQRSACAFAVVLIAWSFLGSAVAVTGNDLPPWSVYLAAAAACIAGGWAAAEWWAGNQETNQLSKLVRAANQSPSGGTN